MGDDKKEQKSECCGDEPCDHIKLLENGVGEKIDALTEKMEELIAHQGRMHEILSAWNNARGFVRVVQIGSKVLTWGAVTLGAILAIWHFIVDGHWK